ncbi:MAG: SDR family NAD(P)-dependent oxidoreductase [Acidobacteriota bacterium]
MTRTFRERFGGAALVTGASAGLGESFAKALAARKMDLVLVARRKERLQRLAADLAKEHGVRVEVLAQDLAAAGATKALAEKVAGTGLDVGLLVCSAGYGTNGAFLELDPAVEARMVDLNCRVVVEHCHTFIPPMVQRKRGGVILFASIAAYQPCPYWAVYGYGATKAFNLMLGEALWAELRPHGIEVLALSPGYTVTEFQDVAKSTGVGPAAKPDDVVAHALKAIGRHPSTVHGKVNWLMVSGARVSSRRTVAKMSAWMSDPRRHPKAQE